MRRILLILSCVAALATAKTPRPLADITLAPPLGAKPIKLSDYKGKVVLLVVFSTDCEACTTAIRYLEKLQKEFKDRGAQMIGAAADPGAITTIKPFIDRYKFTIPLGVLTEDQARLLTDMGPTDHLKVPAYLFIDKKGQVRFQYGADATFFNATDKNTRGVIEGLLHQ